MSGDNFEPKAGIFPCPLVIVAVNSASDFFWTSSDLRSFAFRAFPVGELPLPSSAWQSTHLALKVLAASSWARAERGRARAARIATNAASAKFAKILRMVFSCFVDYRRAYRRTRV